ncbi:hypothetical protein M8C21_017405 [Ambrosia artemisiifolia]|uniref:Uncharacterized protein n=1 Tax=Ambrosia artemisiifolia TaxID=4212 RepID=A0AAD5G3S5_AMBAR|nr:hypothetical protein M8C21_017405 [Ambrosia artemisiifolia]
MENIVSDDKFWKGLRVFYDHTALNPVKKRYPIVSKEYKLAVDKARQKLRGLMYKEFCAPLMIRVACRFAAAYGVNASTSGSMMTNAKQDDDGLSIAVRLLSPLKEQFPIISHADFYQAQSFNWIRNNSRWKTVEWSKWCESPFQVF